MKLTELDDKQWDALVKLMFHVSLGGKIPETLRCRQMRANLGKPAEEHVPARARP